MGSRSGEWLNAPSGAIHPDVALASNVPVSPHASPAPEAFNCNASVAREGGFLAPAGHESCLFCRFDNFRH